MSDKVLHSLETENRCANWLVMIHFKKISDSLEHPAGDLALGKLQRMIRANTSRQAFAVPHRVSESCR